MVNDTLRFSELVGMLERHGFRLLKEKGSIRYYRKPEHDRLTASIIMGKRSANRHMPRHTEAAGIKPGGNDD